MSSREKILAAVRASKPAQRELPEVNIPVSHNGLIEKYTQVATGIGAKVYEVKDISDVRSILMDRFNVDSRWVSSLPEFADLAETNIATVDPHTLEDVELAIIQSDLGVAENSALWIPEISIPQRVVPFICQHLAVLIIRDKIVPTMHQAYGIIGSGDYGYGAFIAGPSKTADIEQSLVLGAHGPRSLSVFILISTSNNNS